MIFIDCVLIRIFSIDFHRFLEVLGGQNGFGSRRLAETAGPGGRGFRASPKEFGGLAENPVRLATMLKTWAKEEAQGPNGCLAARRLAARSLLARVSAGLANGGN